MNGIPHALLVDANGTVVWKDHPALLTGEIVERALKGTLQKPLWEWGSEAEGVRKAVLRSKFKEALAKASELGEAEQGPAILAAVQGMVRGKVDALQASYAEGDFLGVLEWADVFSKQVSGLPEEAAIDELVARIKSDDRAKDVIKGQKKLAKLVPEGGKMKRKEIAKALEELRELKADYPDTFVAAEADRLIQKLNEMSGD